jgi:predicted regulator of Ras-like GTPase activity (Roadblock/LC7/MglB family)
VNHSEQRSEAPGPTSLDEILHLVNEAREFEAVVLASTDGLLIATVPTDYDSEVTAALVALLRKVSSDAQQQLGMAEVDEVTIRSRDRVRLVCRYFVVGEQGLILVAIVPPEHYYRRVTNRAIKRIRQLLA